MNKLTFFSGPDNSFLKDIIINLRKDYDVRSFFAGGQKECVHLYETTDVAWFEWCDQFTNTVLAGPKYKPTIVRLHSYEYFTDMPSHLNPEKYDKMVFVSETVKQLCLKKFQIPAEKAVVIPNGVNMNKFSIPADKKFNKKIAWIGSLNYKKAPELALHLFYHIWKNDPEYTFHIAGTFQDERIHMYCSTLMERMPFKIQYDGHVEDIPKYLEDKDFVLSTSLFESFQYSIAEGMASGVVPLVHGWLGAENTYPHKYIFNTFDDCMEIIKKFEDSAEKNAIRIQNRNYIDKNFSLDKQIIQVRKLVDSLCESGS